jgi:hypothetical protein
MLDVPEPDVAKISLDLIPVQDMPPLELPASPTPGVADTAIDLAPVRDDPPAAAARATDVTDTVIDLIPVRDLPEDAPVLAAQPASAAQPAPAPAPALAPALAPAPGPAGRPSPNATRKRRDHRDHRDHRGRGVHAGRVAGGPWETDERAPLSRRLQIFRRIPATHQLSAPRRLPVSRRLADPRRLTAPRRLASWGPARRSVSGECVAGLVLATTVPLCLLQVPYAALPQLASAGEASAQAGASAVLRAASLALPFAVAFAPLAALATRRFRALPVLLAGLIATVAGDAVTGSGTATGTHTAAGGALHGIAAGLTIVASVALVTERAGLSRRLLAAWWAAVVVAALAVLPGLTLSQHAAGGWQTTLGPVPWLTIAAVAVIAVYPLLAGQPRPDRPQPVTPRTASAAPRLDEQDADGAGDAPALPRQDGLVVIIGGTAAAAPRQARWRRDGAERAVRPPAVSARMAAERVRLSLLVPPALALGVVAVAATYRPGDTIVVAAVCGAAALLVMAAMAVRGAIGDGFVVACAVTGLALAPTSAALAGLRALAAGTTHGTDGTALALAAVAGAIVGAAAGFAASQAVQGARPALVSLVPAGGLLLAATGLVAACIAGPFTGPALLGVLTAAVTGGLSTALARSASRTTMAGAMAGVIVLAGAALAGYLVAGAIRAQLAGVTTQVTPPGQVPHALVAANGWWQLLAAAAAVAVALSACARRTRETERSGRAAPSDGGGGQVRPVHG